MKKFLSLLLALTMMSLMLAACGGGEEAPASEAPAAEESVSEEPAGEEEPASTEAAGITVAVAFGDQTEGQAKMRRSYEAYAEQVGINFIYTNAEATLNKQISDIESLVVQEPDVLVIHAIDSEGVVSIAEETQAAGIPVVDGLYGLASNNIETHCVASMSHRGRMQAEMLIEYLEAHPDVTLNMGLIHGTNNSQTQEIVDAFHETMSGMIDEGRAVVVAEQNADHMADKATAIAEDWVTAFPEINCIVADSDEMALAALNAYAGAGYDLNTEEFVIVGADLTERAWNEINDGRMYGTVHNDFNKLAEIIMDVCIRIADGEDVGASQDMAAAGFMNKVTQANLPALEDI